MRRYEPLWALMKDRWSIELKIQKEAQRTIIQGLRKEKWRDQKFKLKNKSDPYKLMHIVKDSSIVFTLVNKHRKSNLKHLI